MKKLLLISLFLSFNSFCFAESGSCRPLTPRDLFKMFGRQKITYRDYFDLVTSKKVSVQRGDDLKNLVRADDPLYFNKQKNVKLIRLANGLRSDVIAKNGKIYLPYCVKEKSLPSKRPASITELRLKPVISKKIINSKVLDPVSNFVKSLGVLYGSVDIKRGDNTLTADIFKVSARGSHQLSNGYSMTGTLGIVHFRNVQHSSSDQTLNSSTAYPEFGVEVRKKSGIFSLGLSLDTLYYFIATDLTNSIQIEPSMISRLSLRPWFSLTDRIGAVGGAGLIKSFDDKKIFGYDYSFGLSYTIGKMNAWTMSLLYNMSNMDTSESTQDDKSKTWVLSLGYVF